MKISKTPYIVLALIMLLCSSIGLFPFGKSAKAEGEGFIEEDAQTIDIGTRLELFVDNEVINSLTGDVELVQHRPEPKDVVIVHNEPWEGNTSNYHTMFKDDDIYRMYYRSSGITDWENPRIAYAESKDGVNWTKPELGLVEFSGSKANNLILSTDPVKGTSNFVAFKDTNPNVSADARYKGIAERDLNKLYGYKSPDGIHWSLMNNGQPIFVSPGQVLFDSQNVVFWDSLQEKYVMFFRHNHNGKRLIRTITSGNFESWDYSQSEALSYSEESLVPTDDFYTNAIQPYERAPHLLIGFPALYEPVSSGVEPYLITSRDGVSFKVWENAVIPKDAPSERDGNRANYASWGLVRTSDAEYSLYATEGYYPKPESRVRQFTYRVDGFVSARGSAQGGELLTKPLIFEGSALAVNFKTWEGGSVYIEVQDLSGNPIDGFSANDFEELNGDFVVKQALWDGNPDLGQLSGTPVRLRFILTNADLYSYRFMGESPAPFSLVSPYNEQEVETSLRLNWESSKDALEYEVYVSKDENFGQLDMKKIVQANFADIEGLQLDTKYYWKARALGANGNETWSSEIRSFRTEPLQLKIVRLDADELSVKVGETSNLQVTADMTDGSQADLTQADVRYESDNPSVAVVDHNGVISALDVGTANIKVTVTVGDVTISDSIEITVEKNFSNIQGQKQLFHDELLIEQLTGVQRVVHGATKLPANPVLKPDKPWEAHVAVMGTVMYDEEESIFKMWYQLWDSRVNTYAGYATSEDGIHWHKPELGITDYGGSKANNIIGKMVISSVVKDLNEENDERRYKMVAQHDGGSLRIYFSPDGINWNEHGGFGYQMSQPATIYDAENERWMTLGNIVANGRRTVYVSYSDDFIKWTPPALFLKADEIDDAMAEEEGYSFSNIYRAGIASYEGQYVSFSSMTRDLNGPTDIQIAFSRDVKNWERSNRQAVISRGSAGSFDFGALFPAITSIVKDDEIWLYYGAWSNLITQPITNRDAAIGLATWRLDGFASMQNDGDAEGIIETKNIIFNGNELQINADVKGNLEVELLDSEGNVIPGFGREDSIPFTGDEISHTVAWNGTPDLGKLSGNQVAIKFYLTDGNLYSYQFVDNGQVPVELEKVVLDAAKQSMAPGESTSLVLTGEMSDGTEADLEEANIVFTSNHPDLANIDVDGKLTIAGNIGEVREIEVWAIVTLNGKAVQSNALRITLEAVNKNVLIDRIMYAQSLVEADYTVESWLQLQAGLAAAIQVRDDEEAAQEDVDAAVESLKDVIAGLKLRIEDPDKPEPSEIRISGGVEIIIPSTGEQTVTERYGAEVLDKDGELMPDEVVQWSVTEAPGVSIEATTGVLTVTDEALAGQITVRATLVSDAAIYTELNVTLRKSVTEPPEPDAEAPQWRSGDELTVSQTKRTSVKLSWPAATDNVGVAGYRIYADVESWKPQVVSDGVHEYTVTNLKSGTTYTFTVKAFDEAGNESMPLSKQATTTRSSGGGGGYVLSNNVNLSDLQVWAEGKRLELSPSFATGTTDYTAHTDAEQVELLAKKADFAARVMLNDEIVSDRVNVELKEGNNTFELTVQAENGTQKTYKLTIIRETSESSEPSEPGEPGVPGEPVEPTVEFDDIVGHWSENYIKHAVLEGFISGYPDGTFKPDNPVTRAEFMMMLASVMNLQGQGSMPSFTDNDQIGGWAKQAVAQAVQNGIVDGYSDGSFRPSAEITRSEMTMMIARALQLELDANAATGFADDEAIPEWAKGAVAVIRELDIIEGRGDNRFVANDTATRAESVVMLLRMLEVSQ